MERQKPSKPETRPLRFLTRVALGGIAAGFVSVNVIHNLGINAYHKELREDRAEDPLNAHTSRIASKFYGDNVTVDCFAKSDRLLNVEREHMETLTGMASNYAIIFPPFHMSVPTEGAYVLLREELCNTIVHTYHSAASDIYDPTTLYPYMVLSHELAHVDGIENEAAAQCQAIEFLPERLVNINYSLDEAAEAAQRIDAFMVGKLSEQYVSDDC